MIFPRTGKQPFLLSQDSTLVHEYEAGEECVRSLSRRVGKFEGMKVQLGGLIRGGSDRSNVKRGTCFDAKPFAKMPLLLRDIHHFMSHY